MPNELLVNRDNKDNPLIFEPKQITSPMQLIEIALKSNAAIDVIERLFALQKEQRDYNARSAYFTAFAEFKRRMPKIEKTRKIEVSGKVRSMYAALEDIVSAVGPVLNELGITHRYKTKTEPDGKTTVTCFLRHVEGYEEEGSSMTAAPDNSGAKSGIQADGSTVSYLERYTLVGSLGIPLYGQDNDGQGDPKISQGIVDEWLLRMENCATPKELQTAYLEAVTAATKVGDFKAGFVFSQCRDKVALNIKREAK